MSTAKSKVIFPPWDLTNWKAIDDRVRGGASVSHLDAVPTGFKGPAARFWGHLDIDTLGGAGFASQRYSFLPFPLELPRSAHRGLTLTTAHSTTHDQAAQASQASHASHKAHAGTFTLVLKTSPSAPRKPDPRVPPSPEPASLNYEIDFTPSAPSSSPSPASEQTGASSAKGPKENVWHFNFDDFKPTYRGREIKPDDPLYQPLRSDTIYELSLMCRSGFGNQKGDFELVILDISPWERNSGRVAVAWGVLCTVVWGMVAWFGALFRRVPPIQLGDEEKEPLI